MGSSVLILESVLALMRYLTNVPVSPLWTPIKDPGLLSSCKHICSVLTCQFHLKKTSYAYGFPGGSVVKNPPAMQMQETRVPSLGLGRCPGEGNGNPLQYSCLENPTDRRAWQVTVQGVTESPTRLKWPSTLSCFRVCVGGAKLEKVSGVCLSCCSAWLVNTLSSKGPRQQQQKAKQCSEDIKHSSSL